MKMRFRWGAACLGWAAAGMMLAELPQLARADNLFWIGGHSDQYGDGQNWSYYEGPSVPPAFAVPGSSNFAVFEKGATVSFSGYFPGQPPTSGNLQILMGGVTFALGPIHYQDALARTFTTNQLYVVAPFEDSSFLQQYGLPNGANGSLFATGGTIIVNGDAVVGGGDAKNVGTLTLQASLMQFNAGLTVAQSAHGNLNIGTASYVTTSGGNSSIGGQFGSIGAATVSGGSTWLLSGSAALTVGLQGSGNLLVQGGSLVSGVTLNIGTSNSATASAAVTVDGSGSQLSFTHLGVGSLGDGTLLIRNGADAFSGSNDGSVHTTIAEQEGRTGAATVTGAGSSWATNGLVVGGGNSGHGSLTISDGALVTSTNYVANVNGTLTSLSSAIGGGHSTVEVTGSGSTWTLSGGLAVSPYGNSTASLTVGAGGIVNVSAALEVNQGGTVQVAGTLNVATMVIDHSDFTQTGTVNISDAATHIGVLTIRNRGTYLGAPNVGIPASGQTDAVGNIYVQDQGSTWTIPGAYFLGAGGGLGTANVKFGGKVYSGDLGVGENTAGQLQVQGFGSAWSSTGMISVGSAASGSIDANNNGAVSASTLNVNSQGSVSATNQGSIQVTNLNVNGGSVQISGAALTSTSTTIMSGSIQLINAGWGNSGTLYVGGNSSTPATGSAATISIQGGSTSIGGTLKIWPQGQVTVDGGASVSVQGVDIQGGSLDTWAGHLSGSGYSMSVAAHGEFAQAYGDFDSAGFPSVTVNGALFDIQNGSIHLSAGQSLAATNGGFVRAVNGSLTINTGASVSIADSTLTTNDVHVVGGLTLNNATLQIHNLQLDGGTLTAVTTFQIDSHLYGQGTINGNIRLAGADVAANGSLNVNGDISGYGVLVGNVTATSLTPIGNLTVSGDHTQLGSQSVRLLSEAPARFDGTLYSDGGSVTSERGLTIASGGNLIGDITIHGDVLNQGWLDVGGDGIGLDFIDGNLVLDSEGVVRIQIGGTDPTDYDHIMVKNGNVTLGGTLELEFINGFLPKQGDTFNIFIDEFSGEFGEVNYGDLDWDLSFTAGGDGLVLNSLMDAVPLPEPSTLALLMLAAPGLWWVYRRRKS